MEHPGLLDQRHDLFDPKKDNRSALMQAKGRVKDNAKVNFCPFKCEMEDLDDNGYCHHLIGFTTDQKTYEPLVPAYDLEGQPNGARVVRVPYAAGPKGTRIPQPLPIPEGAKLERITCSYRVYYNGKPDLPADLLKPVPKKTKTRKPELV